jgi:hypothetical protein
MHFQKYSPVLQKIIHCYIFINFQKYSLFLQKKIILGYIFMNFQKYSLSKKWKHIYKFPKRIIPPEKIW